MSLKAKFGAGAAPGVGAGTTCNSGPDQICSDGYCYNHLLPCPSGLTQLLSNACGGVGAICTTGKCPDGDCNGAGSGGCLQVNLFYLD